MAEKGLFFNAFPNSQYETGYDRNYSADDISDWLSIVCESGVVKSDNEVGTGIPQGLKVVASSGLNVAVNVGKATIRGKGYINDSLLTLGLDIAPTTTSRYDLIILRQDNSQLVEAPARSNYVFVQKGTTSIPTIDNLVRTSTIYDLLLGYVEVKPNATTIEQTDITDTRGDKDLCPYFTAVKGYDDYYDAIVQRFEYDTTLPTATTHVITNLVSDLYNQKYSLINVYTNGLKEESGDYTIGINSGVITITFNGTKNAGTQISVVLNNFIDGEGLSTAIGDYNNWVNAVSRLQATNVYHYLCNGINDNVVICDLINELLENRDADFVVKVYGNVGISSAYSGTGTSNDPYEIFHINQSLNTHGIRTTIDFSNAGVIEYTPPNGSVTCVFAGGYTNIIGANVKCENTSTSTYIQGFTFDSKWLVQKSTFVLSGYNMTFIGRSGTFVDCKGIVTNTAGYSYCFYPQSNTLTEVRGGEYYAYLVDNTKKSALVGQTTSGSTIVLVDVSCPTKAVSGYSQTHSVYQTTGRLSCYGLISALPIDSPSTTFYGTLSTSIPDQRF